MNSSMFYSVLFQSVIHSISPYFIQSDFIQSFSYIPIVPFYLTFYLTLFHSVSHAIISHSFLSFHSLSITYNLISSHSIHSILPAYCNKLTRAFQSESLLVLLISAWYNYLLDSSIPHRF